MKILLTGGLGYIGSHLAVHMLSLNYQVVILDNLSNSNLEVVARVEKASSKKITFYSGDVCDQKLIEEILLRHQIVAVIHLAGCKSVSESIYQPEKYYTNNVYGTLSLLSAMSRQNVKKLIFSSSAAVYGIPQYLPIDELHPTQPLTPYGNSKLQAEQIINDFAKADRSWNVNILRYFNPGGAHSSGYIGEWPDGEQVNLLANLFRVATGKKSAVTIYGGDFSTFDGTGERDYIHIMDLVYGHVNALEILFSNKNSSQLIGDQNNSQTINLGVGRPISVLNMIKCVEVATGEKLNYKIVEKREGEVAVCYADVKKAEDILNWKAKYTLHDICQSGWHFIKNMVEIK